MTHGGCIAVAFIAVAALLILAYMSRRAFEQLGTPAPCHGPGGAGGAGEAISPDSLALRSAQLTSFAPPGGLNAYGRGWPFGGQVWPQYDPARLGVEQELLGLTPVGRYRALGILP